MPQQRYYFQYSGPPSDGIEVLGFLIVTRNNYQGSQETIQQHFSPSDRHPFTCDGRVCSGYSYHYTFGYNTDLDAVEYVYVEIRSGVDSAYDTDRILRDLLMRLQSIWFGSMVRDSSAGWRIGLPGGTTWPSGLPPLIPVNAPRTEGALHRSSWSDTLLQAVASSAATLLALIVFMAILRGLVPADFADPTSEPDPQATPFTPPPPLSYIVVTSPAPQIDEGDCSEGCIYPPQRQCPDTMLKGFVMPANGLKYYASRGIPSYDTLPFDPMTKLGSRWFCTPQQAEAKGYVAYP